MRYLSFLKCAALLSVLWMAVPVSEALADCASYNNDEAGCLDPTKGSTCTWTPGAGSSQGTCSPAAFNCLDASGQWNDGLDGVQCTMSDGSGGVCKSPGVCQTPEMSDILAISFLVIAGYMIYRIRKKRATA